MIHHYLALYCLYATFKDVNTFMCDPKKGEGKSQEKVVMWALIWPAIYIFSVVANFLSSWAGHWLIELTFAAFFVMVFVRIRSHLQSFPKFYAATAEWCHMFWENRAKHAVSWLTEKCKKVFRHVVFPSPAPVAEEAKSS